MSKIKWGAIVVDGRGKLGGHVFTKTRSGATMRTKVTPVNPQSPAQAAARSRLGSQSQAWRGLTEAQRIGWNDLAARTAKTNIFGDQYFPTGKNLFTGLNSNLLLINEPAVLSAPELAEMPVVLNATVNIDGPPMDIATSFSFSGTTGDTKLVCEATAPMSAGRFNFDGSYRIISTDSAEMDSEQLGLLYEAKFGTVPTGSKVGFRFYFVHQVTGQQSPRFATTAIMP